MSVRQRLIRDFLYPIDMWRSGDLARLRHLKEFERTQFLALPDLRAIQLERLRSLLEHAYLECPFYKERFDRAGVTPHDLTTLEDLRAFPILDKQNIQENRDSMVARSWPKEDLVLNHTGGSTGTPLTFFLSHDRLSSRWAATIRHNRWAGLDIGDKVASLWGAFADAPGREWRQRLRQILLDRQIFLNTAHITEEKLAGFHDEMRRFRPKTIVAYARSVALLARFLKARGISAYQPQSIVTTAEVLEPEDRSLVEDVFGCPIFNRYGCREVSVIATECAEHHGLHVMAEGLYVEVVRGGRLAEPGEVGEVLVTDLMNLAMPLIRYRIGDVAAWEAGKCPCGRALPRLGGLMGRSTDFLVGHDGRLVSGPFLTLAAVAKRPSLGQLQIQQDRVGAVHFRVRPGPRFQDPADLEFLRDTALKYLGETSEVDWELVDELPCEPSGKYLFCRSTVAPGFLGTGSGHR
jgi:phenylacetate-CoA ligase